jgi:hypothetical protein
MRSAIIASSIVTVGALSFVGNVSVYAVSVVDPVPERDSYRESFCRFCNRSLLLLLLLLGRGSPLRMLLLLV